MKQVLKLNKHLSFDNWYDAISNYNKLQKLDMYNNITANFKVNNLLLEAIDYNQQLIKNVKHEKTDIINTTRDISLLD